MHTQFILCKQFVFGGCWFVKQGVVVSSGVCVCVSRIRCVYEVQSLVCINNILALESVRCRGRRVSLSRSSQARLLVLVASPSPSLSLTELWEAWGADVWERSQLKTFSLPVRGAQAFCPLVHAVTCQTEREGEESLSSGAVRFRSSRWKCIGLLSFNHLHKRSTEEIRFINPMLQSVTRFSNRPRTSHHLFWFYALLNNLFNLFLYACCPNWFHCNLQMRTSVLLLLLVLLFIIITNY